MDDKSILTDVKKAIGISSDYDYFDSDILMHINTVLSTLTQVGIGSLTNPVYADSKWSDFISDDPRLSMVKTYVYLRVKLLFDPPTSSSLIESINNQVKEIEWRLFVIGDESKTSFNS